ncbi:MAG: penicillin-binding protein 1B [Gammaproteobacteria bacterium]|nr:penicillin-binding protein 1B [Gammaproteobacteria bacterium]
MRSGATRCDMAERNLLRRLIGLLRRRVVWITLAVLAVVFAGYVLWLDWLVTSRFDGRRWTLPAHVYARPLEVYNGLPLDADGFTAELKRLGYRRVGVPDSPGTWSRNGTRIELTTRPFRFWDGWQKAQRVAVGFGGDVVTALRTPGGPELPLLRLDPLLIGSVFPEDGEDRVVLPPDEVPRLLRSAIMAVEDRRFEHHPGVDLIGILRAFWVNVTSGSMRQGASTLNQQLVRSYFLTNERTLSRKLREALMAVLLEIHYTKADLLNAYINEIYMGQDGSRAIHGFGLASQFYFSKPPSELDLHEIATLVAIMRGPSYYDPRRHPQRVLDRRNLVLRMMGAQGIITAEERDLASARKLGVVRERGSGASYFPAFLRIVHRELKQHYREEDLTTEGLRVFTTLDPMLQTQAEAALAVGVARLGAKKKDKPLEGAVVVANPQTAELLAVVGGRHSGFEGYNRAVEARRPIGSLVKPVVYLAAIEQGRTLATRIDDAPVSVKLAKGKTWQPQNFDGVAHGEVPLVRALAESMNMATVRLGMEVGVPKVVKLLDRLGATTDAPPNPSLLLGALDLAPLEVAQVYSTLASGGFRTPLRAVRAVQGPKGEPLEQFPLSTEQAADPAAVYQLDQALVQVMLRGTGRAARGRLPPGIVTAGKTGTSNDLRDSWFAGFTQDLLAVVWVGYDDNSPTGLTGASGAMSVWSDFMASAPLVSFEALPADGLVNLRIDYATGLGAGEDCDNTVLVPVPAGTEVPPHPGCAPEPDNIVENAFEWLRDLVQ